jgi:hypothetical protein
VPWLDPSLSLRWGPYTKLDGDEQQKIVTAVVSAKKEGIITTRMALEKIAPIFGIENVDAALHTLEEEQQKRDQAEVAKATAQATAEQENLHRLAAAANGNPIAKANRGRGKGQPESAPSGGSGSDGAPPPSEE